MTLHRMWMFAIPLALIGAVTAASGQTTTTTTTIETWREPLALSPRQRSVIYRTVRRSREVVVAPEVMIRRGSVLPPTVVLSPLPNEVYVEAPQLTTYRYFYVNNQLVLVDPRTSEVVDIIDE